MPKGKTVRKSTHNVFKSVVGKAIQREGERRVIDAFDRMLTGRTTRKQPESRTMTTTSTESKKKKKRVTFEKSRYVGRMKKANRVRKDPYIAHGFRHNVETSGKVSDPDCVYVGHATYINVLAFRMVLQCLLRKVFELGGLTITSSTDPLYPTANNLVDGYVLRLDTIDNVGSITSYSYGVPAGATIESLAGNLTTAGTWSDFSNQMLNYAIGAGNNAAASRNTIEPFQLRLFNDVFNGVDSRYNIVSTLNLRDVYIKSSFKSDMKIQNRTVSATGSESTENVSSNPLYLKKYTFEGSPRVRDKSRIVQEPFALTGVFTGHADAMGNYAKEPLHSNLFWNTRGVISGVLQPGDIKSDMIYMKHTAHLLRYLRWLGGYMEDIDGLTNGYKGPYVLYALEDVINVNATELISIAYEVNRNMAVMCYTKKKKFSSGSNFQQTQSSEYTPPP